MAFFIWNQNNSGGNFVVNDDLTWRVVIQADTYGEAEYKALNLGIYYNGCNDGLDCSCCGDRWYEGQELGDDELKDQMLEEYLQEYANEYGRENPSIIIHYLDGSKENIMRAVDHE